jgi:VWFA-related protein
MPSMFFCCIVTALLSAPALAIGQSAPVEPSVSIRSEVNLVVLDVVVTDARKKPVHNLKKGDFTVLEDGHSQTIKTFEEHSAAEGAKLPALPKLEPGTFTNYSPTPENGALNILLLDTLNTPMNDQPLVRAQMLQYLKQARPGVRMAVFGLNSQLRLLQGFTSDPELLRAVLNRKETRPKGSSLMNHPVSGDNPGADDPMMDSIEDALGNSPSSEAVLANLQQFQAEQQSFQFQLRARYTLDALNQLGRYLSHLPGRKNLIWFSGSFPINLLPGADPSNPFGIVASADDEFQETTDLLARRQVAVYPIDARGLMTAPMFDASNSSDGYGRNPDALRRDLSAFSSRIAEEHATMSRLAEATGGKAFINTNGLKEAVEEAVEAGSNYYTLTYSPSNQEWKGGFRKIQVKMERQRLILAYRHGYYANDPHRPNHHGESRDVAADSASFRAIRTAMLPGGPDPTEIIFAATVRPSAGGTEPALAPGNQATSKASGPFRRYTALLSVDARDIDCATNPDGARHCDLESFIFVYDADGAVYNSQTALIKQDFPASRFASLLQRGIRFRQEISVPVKGEFSFRIGVHDMATHRVGAVEFPVDMVSKLPPFSEPAPVPDEAAAAN